MFWIPLLLIAAGIFILVYGGLLFRFTLAIGLFVLGLSLSLWLLSGQEPVTRILISLAIGGIAAIVGYALVKMALHIAGGLLGAMAVLVVLSILPVTPPDSFSVLLVIAGLVVVGIFGNRLGDWIIILATTLTGAYAIVMGLTHWFPASVEVAEGYTSALVPFPGPAFVIFIIILAIGILAQHRLRSFKGRLLNTN